MNNNWIKTLSETVPYLESTSLAKEFRYTWSRARHNHVNSELHIILQGNCKLEIEDDIINVSEGQALLIHPHAFHCSIGISRPFLRLSVSFLLNDETAIWGNMKKEKSYFLFHITPAMAQTCYDIFKEYDRESLYGKQEMLSALLSQLLICTLRATHQTKPSSSNANTTEHFMFQTIDNFFAIPIEPIEKDDSRQALAAQLHCSERQLNRLIYKLYGTTFQQKRLQARMDYAKFLLRNTNKTITEICTLVGYSNKSTFYKFFNAHCGMTPSEFRHSYRKTSF